MNSLHYQIKGSGPPMVLLHGFMESLDLWQPYLPSLTKDFSVVMINLPGHGNSPVLSDTHSMDMMAKEVKKILDKEHINRSTIIGHSMGGYVSLEFARLFPDYLNGITLFHSHPDADTAEAKNNRDRTIELVRQKKENFISTFIPSLYAEANRNHLKTTIDQQIKKARTMSAQGIIAALKGMKERQSAVELIQTLNLPFLFIVGKQDSRIRYERMLEIIGMPKHSEALLLEKVGHMGFHEAEYECMTSIHNFVRKCSRV
ncbi:MAG: alpha/beta hydrolase [Bacteroidales bacterium]